MREAAAAAQAAGRPYTLSVRARPCAHRFLMPSSRRAVSPGNIAGDSIAARPDPDQTPAFREPYAAPERSDHDSLREPRFPAWLGDTHGRRLQEPAIRSLVARTPEWRCKLRRTQAGEMPWPRSVPRLRVVSPLTYLQSFMHRTARASGRSSMRKPLRFGICTFVRLCASITASCGTSPFRFSKYADNA